MGEGGVGVKTAGFQQIAGFVKGIAHILRLMGIGTDGNQFAPQFMITFHNVQTGIGFPQTVAESGSVYFQGFFLVN